MSTAVVEDRPATSVGRPLFTVYQLGWLGFQVVLVVTIAVGVFLRNKDFSLLWQDPTGQKMALMAGLFLVGNCLLFAGGCVVGNRWIASALWRNVLLGVLTLAGMYFLYLPAVFVLLTGPAALAIQRNLAP